MFASVMPNCEFEHLIRLFRLSICLWIIYRYYKQLGLERFLQAFPKTGRKFRILVRYDPVQTIPIAQQKLSIKYIGPVFYGVSFVSKQKKLSFGSFISGCEYCIESIVVFDHLQYIFGSNYRECYHKVEDDRIYRL